MKLGIFCAGSLGIEILSVIVNEKLQYEEILFIDDVTEKKYIKGKKVYKSQEIFSKFSNYDIRIIIASGEPKYRKKIYEIIKDKGYLLETIISQHSVVYNKSIAEGVVVFPNCYIGADVIIGENIIVHSGCNIVEGSKIGSHSFLSLGCFIGSRTTIGLGCFIGPNASISDHLSIEDSVIVGMGSVVLKNLEANSVYVGNPAKFLKGNESGLVF